MKSVHTVNNTDYLVVVVVVVVVVVQQKAVRYV